MTVGARPNHVPLRKIKLLFINSSPCPAINQNPFVIRFVFEFFVILILKTRVLRQYNSIIYIYIYIRF